MARAYREQTQKQCHPFVFCLVKIPFYVWYYCAHTMFCSRKWAHIYIKHSVYTPRVAAIESGWKKQTVVCEYTNENINWGENEIGKITKATLNARVSLSLLYVCYVYLLFFVVLTCSFSPLHSFFRSYHFILALPFFSLSFKQQQQ